MDPGPVGPGVTWGRAWVSVSGLAEEAFERDLRLAEFVLREAEVIPGAGKLGVKLDGFFQFGNNPAAFAVFTHLSALNSVGSNSLAYFS